VIENRIGAGTVLGTQAAAAAPADGYTLVIGGLSNIVFNAGLYKKLPYDPLKDLVPVAMAYTLCYILVGSKELPQKTTAEIVTAAKQKPSSISLANAGTGTGQHLMGVAFQKYAGIKFLEVPYRGASAVYPDLLSGRVDLFFDSATAALPYIKDGQARGIAILSARRNAQIPDVPTMTESGMANLEIESWLGVFAPAKTPKPVIETLRTAIAQSLPDLRERFIATGGDVFEIAPDKLDSFVKAEYDKRTALIRVLLSLIQRRRSRRGVWQASAVRRDRADQEAARIPRGRAGGHLAAGQLGRLHSGMDDARGCGSTCAD